MKPWVRTRHSAGILLVIFVSLLRPSHADDSTGRDATRGDIRVGVITQQDGPHLGIYFPAIAACTSVSDVAVADASGTTFASAKKRWQAC